MIKGFFRRDPLAPVIDRLHGDIVAAVRQPSLYLDYGVADTFEGRFELLVLVATTALRRLDKAEGEGPALAQRLVDAVFSHLDIAMREIGVSDVAVPKRMKKMAGEFAGRSHVYGSALDAGDTAGLADALSRNVFGGHHGPKSQQADRLARYAFALDRALAAFPDSSIGKVSMPFPAALDTPAAPGDTAEGEVS